MFLHKAIPIVNKLEAKLGLWLLGLGLERLHVRCVDWRTRGYLISLGA
ncbi:MAG: hypothetical protein IPH53_22600 [Flavobacteriales bacterium]|nr:hypothetical protein [Flavobacteriales bacterium]